MVNISKVFATICLIAIITGCMPVQSDQVLSQPKGQQLVANVGGVVLKVKKTRDLPNVFGKADMFGRTVDEGYTELRYEGINKAGEVVFQLMDLDVYSDEDTLSRSGSHSNSNFNGSANQTFANVSGSSNTFVAANAHKQILPAHTSAFNVNFHKKPSIVVANQTIHILEADSVNLTYEIK